MQNEEPDEGGVPAENVVATLNHPGYLESQSKSICERCHEATPQRDVTFPARSVAVAYWKSGDDDGAAVGAADGPYVSPTNVGALLGDSDGSNDGGGGGGDDDDDDDNNRCSMNTLTFAST